jgi:hypothetical protein
MASTAMCRRRAGGSAPAAQSAAVETMPSATRGSRRSGDGAHELFRPPNADGIVPHLILGIFKSSAIVRPAEPALSWITLRLESFARVHPYILRWSGESCINKIRKIYENLLNKKIYPQVILFPRRRISSFSFCICLSKESTTHKCCLDSRPFLSF